LEVSGQLHPPAPGHGTHWIKGWVATDTDVDEVERRKILPLPGLVLQSLGRVNRSQLRYRGSRCLLIIIIIEKTALLIK
jgi:hypothetical protein